MMNILSYKVSTEPGQGQTQLFALALTFARDFELLLLDEPEQRLDPDRLDLVRDVVRNMADRGTTIVMASHNSHLVDQVADRVLHIEEAVHDDRI